MQPDVASGSPPPVQSSQSNVTFLGLERRSRVLIWPTRPFVRLFPFPLSILARWRRPASDDDNGRRGRRRRNIRTLHKKT